jgi:tetratricopeptide (TPR) repeat protein
MAHGVNLVGMSHNIIIAILGRTAIIIIAAIMMLTIGAAASTDNSTKNDIAASEIELAHLFDALIVAETPEEASRITAKIWFLWSYDTEDNTSLGLMKRGMTFMESGNLSIAEDIFTRILQREPDYMEAWNKRATVRYMLNNLDGSESDIREVLSREPRHFGALSGLGMINLKRGEFLNALEIYQNILLIHPFSPDANRLIGQLHRLLGGHAA